MCLWLVILSVVDFLLIAFFSQRNPRKCEHYTSFGPIVACGLWLWHEVLCFSPHPTPPISITSFHLNLSQYKKKHSLNILQRRQTKNSVNDKAKNTPIENDAERIWADRTPTSAIRYGWRFIYPLAAWIHGHGGNKSCFAVINTPRLLCGTCGEEIDNVSRCTRSSLCRGYDSSRIDDRCRWPWVSYK